MIKIKQAIMAIKKSEIYRSLWASCDELRGGMDASQYKDYILTLFFVKYVSDKFKDEKYAEIEIPDITSSQIQFQYYNCHANFKNCK
jgi:type I restriction-modification system DNA methylase subunit